MDETILGTPHTLIVSYLVIRLNPAVFFGCAQRSRDILLLDRGANLLFKRLQGLLNVDLVTEVDISSLDQHFDFLDFLLYLGLDALLPLVTKITVHYALRGLVLPRDFYWSLLRLWGLMSRMVLAKS